MNYPRVIMFVIITLLLGTLGITVKEYRREVENLHGTIARACSMRMAPGTQIICHDPKSGAAWCDSDGKNIVCEAGGFEFSFNH